MAQTNKIKFKEMKTINYYMAASKKEARVLAGKNIKEPFTVEIHKRICKGTSIYKIR